MRDVSRILFVGIFVIFGGFLNHSAIADDDANSKEEPAEYASVAPMMDFSKVKSKENERLKEITRSSKDSTFVPCATEEECLRDLQEAQTAQEDSDKFQLVAEFVTAPKNGMYLYKQPIAKPKQ